MYLPVLLLYTLLVVQRLLAGNHMWSITPDAVYYVLAAQRTAEGNLVESLSGQWMPLVSWCAAPLVRLLGWPPLTAVMAVNVLAGAALLILLVRLASRRVGRSAALLAGLAAASDPLLLGAATTPFSDALYATLVLGAFAALVDPAAWRTQRGSREVVKPALSIFFAVSLLLSRLVGLPLVVLLFGLLVIDRGSPLRSRLVGSALYAGVVGGLLLTLCLFFYSRTGLFAPTLHVVMNNVWTESDFMQREWLGHRLTTRSNESLYYSLYDGEHTFVGDLEQLVPGAKPPPRPRGDLSKRLRYHVDCLGSYLWGLGAFVALPVMALASVGAWALWKRGETAFLARCALWFTASTLLMVASLTDPRYFLPLVPAAYLLAAAGIGLLSERRRGAVSAVLLAALLSFNLLLGLKESNLIMLLRGGRPDLEHTGGRYIYEQFGPGRRIMTLDNYRSAVDSRGRWRPVPLSSDPGQLSRYMDRHRVEFVVVPQPLPDGEPRVPSLKTMLESDSALELVWRGPQEAVYRREFLR